MDLGTTTLALTEADNGKSFDVKPGVFVSVTLPSNQGSTGYHWVDDSPYNDADDNSEIVVSVFNLLSQHYTSGMSKLMGAPGISVLSYQQSSIGAGSIKINLVAPDGKVVENVAFGFMATN